MYSYVYKRTNEKFSVFSKILALSTAIFWILYKLNFYIRVCSLSNVLKKNSVSNYFELNIWEYRSHSARLYCMWCIKNSIIIIIIYWKISPQGSIHLIYTL